MFSRTPRAPAQHEILYLGEAFTWQKDASVTDAGANARNKSGPPLR